jgi:hypothetical protein
MIQIVTPLWIRTHVVDSHPEDNPESFGEARVDPKALWNRRWSKFITDAQALHDGFFKEVLTLTLESGKTVVSVDGIPHDQAEAAEKFLNGIIKKLSFYAETSKQKEDALQPDPEPYDAPGETD